MTRDAFCKAQEIKKKIDAAHQLYNIVSNSTLSSNEDEFEAHNEHVRKDNMILCCMHKGDSLFGKERDVRFTREISNTYGRSVSGEYYMAGNFVFGEDIPADLAERLEAEICLYENELEEKFANLSGDYIEED